MRKLFLTAILALFAYNLGIEVYAQSLKGRAVWGHPGIVGRSQESIADFAEQISKANINTLVMMVKGGGGDIYWPSEKFPDAVRSGYDDFDMPAILIEECHKRGVEVHAWFCDFPEGSNSAVNQKHPDWHMTNAEGEPTDSEILRGRQYGMRWMCPARRPGYTDQWLIPLIEEFALRYDIDAIHHDYVRYPGDLAPDTYCFCDYCLDEIPRYAGFYKEAYPDEAFYPSYDRPHLEAHWEPGPRVLPANWDEMPRKAKSRFLLEGNFFSGGRNDLDYFFYEYRTHWIKEFTREVYETVRASKPDMAFSAAVFKNPVHSGRFIGQDWRKFSDWVHYMMPMDYLSHYPGTFEQYLVLLDESIQDQKRWAANSEHFWPGIASYQLYSDEGRFHRMVENVVEGEDSLEDLQGSFTAVEESLQKHAPLTAKALAAYFESESDSDKTKALESLKAFLKEFPRYYRPPEKFLRTLEQVKQTGVEGLVVFSIEDVIRNGLLDDLGKFFAQ